MNTDQKLVLFTTLPPGVLLYFYYVTWTSGIAKSVQRIGHGLDDPGFDYQHWEENILFFTTFTTNHLRLMRRLRISGFIIHSLYTPSWRTRDKFTFIIFVTTS
jgi:hypothetical protein